MKETALREVAKVRVRKMIRDKENEQIILKYDTPDEKTVPKWQVERYREFLKEELDSYKKELGEKQKKQEERTKPQVRKSQSSKKKSGLFRH